MNHQTPLSALSDELSQAKTKKKEMDRLSHEKGGGTSLRSPFLARHFASFLQQKRPAGVNIRLVFKNIWRYICVKHLIELPGILPTTALFLSQNSCRYPKKLL